MRRLSLTTALLLLLAPLSTFAAMNGTLPALTDHWVGYTAITIFVIAIRYCIN